LEETLKETLTIFNPDSDAAPGLGELTETQIWTTLGKLAAIVEKLH
jgi:hypothetical protein